MWLSQKETWKRGNCYVTYVSKRTKLAAKIISLFTWSKQKWLFLEGRLLSSQSEQSEVFKKLRLAGKKPALQKSHFCFDHVNRLNVYDSTDFHLRTGVSVISSSAAMWKLVRCVLLYYHMLILFKKTRKYIIRFYTKFWWGFWNDQFRISFETF